MRHISLQSRSLAIAIWLAIPALVVPVLPMAVQAQETPSTAAKQPPRQRPATAQGTSPSSNPSSSVLSLLPPDSVTEATLKTSDGPQLNYTATAGTLALFDQSGEKSAQIFYTAYVAKNAPAGRPVTFAFNGGPGAASAFLHLGMVGPKILDFGPNANDGANARLIDNPDSWLGFTDLVLIDPIGTGWSRAAKPDDASHFYGVNADAEAMAKTIALYVAKNSRGDSPKYLLGESYGGFRAAKVTGNLLQDQGIAVSGIVMVSPLIDGGLTFEGTRLALGAALQLPSLAAAEMERRNNFSPDAIKAAERFAMTEYLTTLAGAPPEATAADAFYNRVASLTGLPIDTVRKTRGFVRDAYVKHLRENEGAIVSIYDAALAAPDPFPESDSSRGDDPVLDGFVRSYGGAFVSYARDQLGYKTDITYTLLARDISGKWDWGRASRYRANAGDDIRQQLSLTPSLRVLIVNGYSDLVVPYATSKYFIDHLPPELAAGRVTLKLYHGGHMFYTNPPSRTAFTKDARAFYASSPAAQLKD